MLMEEARMKHSHRVAEYMAEHSAEYGLEDKSMFLLGLLHDIGYIYKSSEHEYDGEYLLSRVGYTFSKFVGEHGLTPQEYMNKYNLSDRKYISNIMILLWNADMMIGQCEEYGYEERLKGIEERHGKDSRAYKSSKEKIEWLKEHIDEYRVGAKE